MKVAVSIFGQLRGDRETWVSLQKYLIDYLKADVFVHSWLTYEDKYYASNLEKNIDDTKENNDKILWFERQILRQKSIMNNLIDFLSIIKPIEIKLDKQIIFDSDKYFMGNKTLWNEIISFQNSASQSYSRMKSIELITNYEISNNFKYDVIYQIRSDILLNNFIGLIKKNGIYTNNLDTIFYGDRNSMIELSKFFIEYVKNCNINSFILPLWHMERQIMNFINNKKLTIIEVKMPTNQHGIKRINNVG